MQEVTNSQTLIRQSNFDRNKRSTCSQKTI